MTTPKATLKYPHLNALARKQADLPDDERIRIIRAGGWLPLEHADATLKKLEELLDWPQVTRMPCYLLVGPSYSGKTSILEHFVRRHPPDLDPVQEVTRYPVVMIDAPPKPDLSDFYSRILDALMTAYKPTAPVHAKYSQVKHLFGQLGVKVLVIDEIHHLIAGSLNRQREFRNALKSLSNEAKISIVASGIEDAYNAFNADPQMSSRFVPIEMPTWPLSRQLAGLMSELEQRTPLRKLSGLYEPELMTVLHARSESMLGDICDLVKEASVDAIRSGTECIIIERLKRLDWVPPSKRKHYRRSLS